MILRGRHFRGVRLALAGCLLISAWFFLCSGSEGAEAAVSNTDFLIPGLDFSRVSFKRGAAIEYLVISEAYGVRDSSKVRMSVLRSNDDLVKLEIISSAWSSRSEEALFLRILFSDSLKEAESEEELYSFIISVEVRKGDEPFRKATEEEIKDFELGDLFLKSGEAEREELENELVSTPAGDFHCEVYRHRREKMERVNLGGNDALRLERETSFLYLSGEVPISGLVRSETARESRTELDIPGIPDGTSRSKKTYLESILIDFEIPSAE